MIDALNNIDYFMSNLFVNIGKKLSDWRWDAGGVWLLASAFLGFLFGVFTIYHGYMIIIVTKQLIYGIDYELTMTIAIEHRNYIIDLQYHASLVYDYTLWIGVRLLRYLKHPNIMKFTLFTWMTSMIVLLVQYTSINPEVHNPPPPSHTTATITNPSSSK